MRFVITAIVVVFLAWPARGTDSALISGDPAGQKLPATAWVAGGSAVVPDAAATGGKAVSNEQPYQPMMIADVPPGADALTVWVRHKGGPIQLKSISEGKQTDRDWVWAKPAKWGWSRVGKYPRADLGQQILLMHGPDAGPIAIDAVVLSSDPDAHPRGYKSDGTREPPTAIPDDSAPAQDVQISAQWDHPTPAISPMLWGTNDYEICNPKSAADADYSARLKAISPQLIRIHEGGLTDDWTDATHRQWDAAKIKAGFDSLASGYGSARIMLNIPGWPAWLAQPRDGILPAENQDEFVALVGQLVDVMRDQVKRPIQYWELLNERDNDYDRAGKIDDLWRLQNRLFAEIKKHDPAALVGGPAFTWPKPAVVDSFLTACGNNVDFVSWHNYASGEPTTPNDDVFARVAEIAKDARFVRDETARLVPGRKPLLFLTEYNIQWTWSPIEPRHGNNFGAAFDACVLHQMAMLGLDGVAVWHAKGHAYGIIDGDNTLRPAGQLYQWGNQYIVGSLVPTTVADPELIDAWAVIRSDSGRSLLLTNRSDHTLNLHVDKTLFDPVSARISRIDSKGVSTDQACPEVLALPGYSVTLVRIRGAR